jgi:hypothetical protein
LGTFYTFCAAVSNVFVPTYAYQVTAAGSVSSVSNPPVTMNAAGQWLYSQYWDNTSTTIPASLVGYVPGHDALAGPQLSPSMTNVQVAGAIQAEIWASLGETPPAGYDWATLVTEANALFGWNNYSSTSVTVDEIALWGPDNNYGYGNPAQGQLDAYAPLQINPYSIAAVPEPATIIIWSLLGAGSWLGMRVWRRRDPRFGDELAGPVRQPWSPEARQAIHEIIARGSHERS